MTDIVERLRSPEFADVAEKYLMREAAAEIEWLLTWVAEARSLHVLMFEKDAEIARLRWALEEIIQAADLPESPEVWCLIPRHLVEQAQAALREVPRGE